MAEIISVRFKDVGKNYYFDPKGKSFNVKDKVIVEEMPGVTVKGKSEPIKMYAVINAVGVKGPQDIHKLREFLGWDEPELEKVNTDEEEKKYKISQ